MAASAMSAGAPEGWSSEAYSIGGAANASCCAPRTGVTAEVAAAPAAAPAAATAAAAAAAAEAAEAVDVTEAVAAAASSAAAPGVMMLSMPSGFLAEPAPSSGEATSFESAEPSSIGSGALSLGVLRLDAPESAAYASIAPASSTIRGSAATCAVATGGGTWRLSTPDPSARAAAAAAVDRGSEGRTSSGPRPVPLPGAAGDERRASQPLPAWSSSSTAALAVERSSRWTAPPNDVELVASGSSESHGVGLDGSCSKFMVLSRPPCAARGGEATVSSKRCDGWDPECAASGRLNVKEGIIVAVLCGVV